MGVPAYLFLAQGFPLLYEGPGPGDAAPGPGRPFRLRLSQERPLGLIVKW